MKKLPYTIAAQDVDLMANSMERRALFSDIRNGTVELDIAILAHIEEDCAVHDFRVSHVRHLMDELNDVLTEYRNHQSLDHDELITLLKTVEYVYDNLSELQ